MLPVKSTLTPTFSSFFDDDWNTLFNWPKGQITRFNSRPSVNIEETENEFIVSVAAPGLTKDNFEVTMDNGRLVIKGSSSTEASENNDRFIHREFSQSSFERSFNLNVKIVDENNIQAKYKDGILTLTVPKRDEAKVKPARQIKIA